MTRLGQTLHLSAGGLPCATPLPRRGARSPLVALAVSLPPTQDSRRGRPPFDGAPSRRSLLLLTAGSALGAGTVKLLDEQVAGPSVSTAVAPPSAATVRAAIAVLLDEGATLAQLYSQMSEFLREYHAGMRSDAPLRLTKGLTFVSRSGSLRDLGEAVEVLQGALSARARLSSVLAGCSLEQVREAGGLLKLVGGTVAHLEKVEAGCKELGRTRVAGKEVQLMEGLQPHLREALADVEVLASRSGKVLK